MENNTQKNNIKLQEDLIVKGNRLHTEAIQQAIISLPKGLSRSITKLFGTGDMGAYPAKQ